MKNLLVAQKEIQNTLAAFDEHILFALERRYFDFLQPDRLELCRNLSQDNFDFRTDLRIIRMDEISYEGNCDNGMHLMHFQNVLASIKDDSHNVLSLIHGDSQTTALYYGLAKRREKEGILGTDQYARMLGQCMHGNFLGAKFAALNGAETQSRIITPLLEYKNILAIPGIPSLRDANGPYVQGIDRFIEAMRGEKYILLCIAEPITIPVIDGMVKNLFDLSSSVHSYVKTTVQKMRGSSDTLNIGLFGMKGIMDSMTDSESVTDGTTNTDGRSDSTSSGEMKMGKGGAILSLLPAVGGLVGGAIGSLFLPGIGTAVGATIGSGLVAPFRDGIAYLSGLPLTTSSGMANTVTNATSRMHSFTRSIANTAGSTTGGGGFGGYARGWNRSSSASQEVLNKTAEYCEKLCDTYITRLQKGKNLGFWNVGVYLMTNDKYTQMRGQGLLRACLAGDDTHWEPIRALPIQDEAAMAYLVNFNNPQYNLLRYGSEKKEIKESVTLGMKLATLTKEMFGGSFEKLYNSLMGSNDDKNSTAILEKIRRTPAICSQEALEKAWKEIEASNLGHPLGPALGGIGTPLNTEELSIIMNLPRREVQGITLRESSAFGVNYCPPQTDDNVELGHLVHKRKVLNDTPFNIPRHLFQKHTFICGVTGSGKTNTCFSILHSLNLPFMIIEPAKSEYRQLLNSIPDLRIYTLGLETVSPFRLNPFEFPQGGHLLAHIDSLKAVFNAAFPMYGPMPYILEEAIIDVYTDKGWDLATSSNIYLNKNSSSRFHDYLPTLQELYNKIETVVLQKQYAQELTMNIGAALKARLSSLLTGSKGLMLDTLRSTPIEELLRSKVLLELKHIGDDEEKCFIMGLLLSQIYEYRDVERASGSPLRHVILIEEAHRLLKHVPEYVSPEVGNSRGKAVETFSNAISEIRDFGEGIIVVDQIPAKLTSDVIKNTTIKIVHRTLAIDDREMVGSTMGLTADQNKELPLLPVGQAVVHSEGSDKPFLVQIKPCKDNGENRINDSHIVEIMHPVHQSDSEIFRRYPGFEKKKDIPATFHRMEFRRFYPEIYMTIIAASILILEKDNQLESFKKRACERIKNLVRIDDALEVDCHIIWNTNRFFEKLNEAFPRTVDHCLTAQRIFIDLWFSDSMDDQKAKAIRDSLTRIIRDTEPLRYLIKALFREDVKLVELITSLKLKELQNKKAQLDQAITDSLSRLLLVNTISNNLKKAFIQSALGNTPHYAVMTDWYAGK